MTVIRSAAFTASRDMDQAAREGVVTSVLTVHVPNVERYVTGGCTGGDAFLGRWLYANYPDAEHVVIVPADRSRVDPWWETVDGPPVTVREMPEGTAYRHRNATLVGQGDMMFGFPAYPEHDLRSLRSGTWQTIRMARRYGKLSMWHCVKPPYRGLVEQWPSDLFGEEAADDPDCE